MLDLKEDIEDNMKTMQECYDYVEETGNSALKFLMLRQSRKKPPSVEEMTKITHQYQSFKKYAFDIVLDEEMDISKHVIKEHCLTTTAVCLTCHRRFEMDKIKRHVQNIHRGEDTSFCDQIVKLSTIKILHGTCKQEKLYNDKKQFWSLALKLLCKTPNESVIECIGSLAQLHSKPQRNNKFKSFESELHVDWNGPNLPKAGPILEKALDRHFGSRKNWRFKTGSSKFITSKVVDRITRESSRLAFLE